MGCINVAASIQMNCIPAPMTADPGAIRRSAPPTFHCCVAAASRATPAAANPTFPAIRRTSETASANAETPPPAPTRSG